MFDEQEYQVDVKFFTSAYITASSQERANEIAREWLGSEDEMASIVIGNRDFTLSEDIKLSNHLSAWGTDGDTPTLM